MQPFVSQIGDSEKDEIRKAWAKYGGIGEIKLSVDGDNMFRAGTLMIFSEKLITDTLKLESLKDLDGYKKIWELMSDL